LGFQRARRAQLFRFIDWIMDLPEAGERLFWQEITRYQEPKQMPFMTIAERIGREQDLLKGIGLGLNSNSARKA